MSEEYGPGFGRTNLFYMIRFAETFPDIQIVHALSEQLSRTRLRQIIYLDDPLQLKRSGIRVAEYLTELPPRQVLERRLHEAIRAARERFKPALQGNEEPK